MWRGLLILAAVVASAAPAAAQTPANANPWARGTELGVATGAAVSAGQTGPLVAGIAGWEVTRWFAVEGRGTWFDRGTGAGGFGADLSGLVNLVAKRELTPFVGAGFGLYHASFDSPASSMSNFYRSRMGDGGPQGPVQAMSFTDPAFRLSTGVDVISWHPWTIRPEASVIFVRHGGRGETMATVGLRIGYRFEDRPITP